MEIGQAHLTGTVEEWTNVCDGIMNLECLHQVASLLADDLIQVLRRNPQIKGYLMENGNRLTLTLSLNLDETKGKRKETIIREWPSTS